MTTIKSAKISKDGNVVPVSVEVEITKGIGIHLVGLADQAVKESLLRVATAIQSLGYYIPGKKIVINLAPTYLRKSGCGYDLPIALGILAESGQIRIPERILEDGIFFGELTLDGRILDTGTERDLIYGIAPDSRTLVITSAIACKRVLSYNGLVGFTSLAWLLRFMGN